MDNVELTMKNPEPGILYPAPIQYVIIPCT